MIEVFKTNINEERMAHLLKEEILSFFPFIRINFDLDDCDKILRIEGNDFVLEKIVQFVRSYGFDCEVLE